jgi:hypothetical protein
VLSASLVGKIKVYVFYVILYTISGWIYYYILAWSSEGMHEILLAVKMPAIKKISAL